MSSIDFTVEDATASGFLEEGYLAANPDVRVAIGKGGPKSGWAHFSTREARNTSM